MIIIEKSLQGYFFENLDQLNKKLICPLPQSTLFYSSNVLDRLALSDTFFDSTEGKVKDKVLGLKLLEATQYSKEEQRRTYKEVGDTALVLCGYFAESTNKKLVDTHYYSQLGIMAYERLNAVSPTLFDIPSFYHMMATCFGQVTTLMTLMAHKSHDVGQSIILFSSESEGIKKVS